MFGMPAVSFFDAGDNGAKGPQVRGFGFLHDGSVDTLFRFHHAVVFNPHDAFPPFPANAGFPPGPEADTLRRQVEQFFLPLDTTMAPTAGRQSSPPSTTGP